MSRHLADLKGLLDVGLSNCPSGAKKWRLRCLQHLATAAVGTHTHLHMHMICTCICTHTGTQPRMHMHARARAGHALADEMIPTMLGEVMLCTKEVNNESRSEAFGVLIHLGYHMEHSVPGGASQLLQMIVAGLAGRTPHMISATIHALARFLYEFSDNVAEHVP